MNNLKQNTSDLDTLIAKANSLPAELDTSDADATENDIVSPKTAYVDGVKVTGTIPTKNSSDLTANGATVNVPAGVYKTDASKSVGTATQATPTVSIDTNGKITASATQSAGYVSAGTKTGTKQLTTKGATTITPTTSEQTVVGSGTFVTGDIKVKGDANLKAANIKKDVEIFGVTGAYEGEDVFETWVFELESGTTVEKQVEVSA